MSKVHPTPWSFSAEDDCEDTPIIDAQGDAVLVRDSGAYPPDLETCREIVDAVNERDKLRDLVRRLSRHLANYITSESENDLLSEARAAIGETRNDAHATD